MPSTKVSVDRGGVRDGFDTIFVVDVGSSFVFLFELLESLVELLVVASTGP